MLALNDICKQANEIAKRSSSGYVTRSTCLRPSDDIFLRFGDGKYHDLHGRADSAYIADCSGAIREGRVKQDDCRTRLIDRRKRLIEIRGKSHN